MVNFKKHILSFLVIVTLTISSCEKFSGGDSISGSWTCREERGDSYRQYTVMIGRAGYGEDTTLFIINNFHNIGFEYDTYVQLKDTVITLKYVTNGDFFVAGKGYVSRDLKSIRWNYSISGPKLSDSYIIAYYQRK